MLIAITLFFSIASKASRNMSKKKKVNDHTGIVFYHGNYNIFLLLELTCFVFVTGGYFRFITLISWATLDKKCQVTF